MGVSGQQLREGEALTLDEFMKHAADAAFVGDADLLRGYAKQVFDERDEARAALDLSLRAWDAAGGPREGMLALIRERDEARAEVERLRGDLARCREVQKATAEGWRHEVAEIAAIVGAPAHTAELAACVRAEAERLREALRTIAAGFDPITGSVDDPSAKQVDGYYRGYATAALEKARLAHAEADAEQAIHNEAFTERYKIAVWIRARAAHMALDDRTPMRVLDALRQVADQIEKGEHAE